jgi:hypothetical protein
MAPPKIFISYSHDSLAPSPKKRSAPNTLIPPPASATWRCVEAEKLEARVKGSLPF